MASFCSSYIKTTSAAVTRAADALSFPFRAPPQAMTVCADFVDLGTGTGSRGILGVATATRYLWLYGNTNTSVAAEHNNGSVARSSNATVSALLGSRLEMRVTLGSDGAVQAFGAVDGGAEASGSASSASSLATTWGNTTLLLNDYDTTKAGFAALRSLKIAAGVQSLTTMRNL